MPRYSDGCAASAHLLCALVLPRPHFFPGEEIRQGARPDVGKGSARGGAGRIRLEVSSPAYEILREYAQIRGATQDGRLHSAKHLPILSGPLEPRRKPAQRRRARFVHGDLESQGDDHQGRRLGAGDDESRPLGSRRRSPTIGGANQVSRAQQSRGEVLPFPPIPVGSDPAVERMVAGPNPGCSSLGAPANAVSLGRS